MGGGGGGGVVPLTVDQLVQGASWKIGFLYILIKYSLMNKAG